MFFCKLHTAAKRLLDCQGCVDLLVFDDIAFAFASCDRCMATLNRVTVSIHRLTVLIREFLNSVGVLCSVRSIFLQTMDKGRPVTDVPFISVIVHIGNSVCGAVLCGCTYHGTLTVSGDGQCFIAAEGQVLAIITLHLELNGGDGRIGGPWCIQYRAV